MKICWDNLENIRLNKNSDFTNHERIFISKICSECGEEFLARKNSKGIFCSVECKNKSKPLKKKLSQQKIGKNNPMYGKKLTKEHKKKISKTLKGRKFTEEHKQKISNSQKGSKNHMFGKSLSKEHKEKLHNSIKGKNHPNWKGGYKNIALYDTYASKISYAEKVRRNKDDPNVLEVKCAYCGKWFIPTFTSVRNRIYALIGKYKGEQRLYCSEECKKSCPIYGKILYPKDFKIGTSREVQPELRQMVFKRDDWICQKCGTRGGTLHCHHVEGILWEPIESADMDKCITLCMECHKSVHKQDGCKYSDLQCK